MEMEDPYRFLVLRFHKIFDSEKILEEIDSKDIIGNPLKVLNDETQSRAFAEDAEHDESKYHSFFSRLNHSHLSYVLLSHLK